LAGSEVINDLIKVDDGLPAKHHLFGEAVAVADG
jgi:hypothetical protein